MSICTCMHMFQDLNFALCREIYIVLQLSDISAELKVISQGINIKTLHSPQKKSRK